MLLPTDADYGRDAGSDASESEAGDNSLTNLNCLIGSRGHKWLSATFQLNRRRDICRWKLGDTWEQL